MGTSSNANRASIALGVAAKALNTSIALGWTSIVADMNSLAFGTFSNATSENVIAIGSGAKNNTKNAISISNDN